MTPKPRVLRQEEQIEKPEAAECWPNSTGTTQLILPSTSWIRRSMRAARPRSWVTAMIVLPRSRTSACRMAKTCSVLF